MYVKEYATAITHYILRLFFLFVVYFIIFSPFFLLTFLRDLIAFSDVQVIAAHENASILWITPLTILIMFPTLLTYAWFFPPLRGSFRHPWEHDFYESNSKKRRRRKKKFILWCAGFIICFFLFTLGLFGRTCLTDDGHILRYNMWNQLTGEISQNDFTTVILNTHKKDKSPDYYYSIRFFDTEENSYWFPRGKFRSSDTDTLQALLHIKSLHDPQKIQIKGTENLEHVVSGCDLSEEETALLYELFDQTS